MKLVMTTLATILLMALPVSVGAQAPAGTSLLEIVTKLENEGYGPITDVSLDRGRWEVETYKDGAPYELHIDPATGRILAEYPDDSTSKPPAKATKLSDIVKGVEAAGYSGITEVSFGTRTWEIEALRGGAKRELRVDPMTGKIVSDRADD